VYIHFVLILQFFILTDEYRKIPPYPQNSRILPSDQKSIDTVLKGFYNQLKYNPGLMKRRMYVGSKPPIYMFRDEQVGV
jgi:hypothetical protein